MGWDDPQWNLSDRQINRFQFDRFLNRYIGLDQIKRAA